MEAASAQLSYNPSSAQLSYNPSSAKLLQPFWDRGKDAWNKIGAQQYSYRSLVKLYLSSDAERVVAPPAKTRIVSCDRRCNRHLFFYIPPPLL